MLGRQDKQKNNAAAEEHSYYENDGPDETDQNRDYQCWQPAKTKAKKEAVLHNCIEPQSKEGTNEYDPACYSMNPG
jgi:hypothetical protein